VCGRGRQLSAGSREGWGDREVRRGALVNSGGLFLGTGERPPEGEGRF